MATKQQTFDVPEKEPWKDADTLHGLYHDDELNQSEIADYLTDRGHDVTPSTISYWMKKHEISTTHTKHDQDDNQEDGAVCETCGGETPGPNNLTCTSCLDEARRKQREAENERRKMPDWKK